MDPDSLTNRDKNIDLERGVMETVKIFMDQDKSVKDRPSRGVKDPQSVKKTKKSIKGPPSPSKGVKDRQLVPIAPVPVLCTAQPATSDRDPFPQSFKMGMHKCSFVKFQSKASFEDLQKFLFGIAKDERCPQLLY